MARPRFQRLSGAQQDEILDAALREFAAHGFGGASLNRIIGAARLSKGAMYYYFDGKQDLYAEVLRRQLERLLQHGEPLVVPDGTDADGFWDAVEEYYRRLVRSMGHEPETGALLRDWLTGAASPALRAAQHDAEQSMMPWLMRLLAAGQGVGAVRTDLPAELLLAAALGLGQAMDTWLISREPAPMGGADEVHVLIDMMRRALQP